MFRLLSLELKKILKARQTIIALCIGIVMTIVMGVAPVLYETVIYPDDLGNKTTLTGIDAIEYKKDVRSSYYGEIRAEDMADALTSYQQTISEVGGMSEYNEDFPTDIYISKIFPIKPLLSKLPETYADSQSGIGATLEDMNVNDVSNFYEQTKLHLIDYINLNYEDSASIQEYATLLYDNVETPFSIYGEFSRDAFDYITLLILIISLICVIITVPVFSENYQNGSDCVFRSTKYGRGSLATIKILAVFIIVIIYYTICLSIQLSILNFSFGVEALNTSVQMLFSSVSLVAMNLGELQILIVLGGLLSILAIVSFTLLLSSKITKPLTVMLLSVVICLSSFMLYPFLSDKWFFYLLPSAGVGLQNSLLYQLISINFLKVFGIVFWTPHIIFALSIIWVIFCVPILIKSYCKHQCA